MSLARDVFQRIEYFYSAFQRNSRENVLNTYFYMMQGKEKEDVREAISALVKIGLVKCVESRGASRWDVAYRKGSSVDIVPTKYALWVMKNYVLRELFMEKGLY
ncbi:MAG: hypothetical protein WC878_06605 [Candidatus Paceibacterota bacterium]|jgi:hypothetical protein